MFLIPVGGGIPAGVLLAKSRGLPWPLTAGLYLVSDIVLAFAFEPLMRGFIWFAKRSQFLTRWREAYLASVRKRGFKYGSGASPLSLIGVAFGVDPMTGRAAARAAGHGFLTGWALAICGDMFFFALIMVSTLWLNGILGDGTWTAVIIMMAMFVVPMVIERWREARRRAAG